MSTIDSARRYEALDHVSQALTLLERVQIRWRRYADTMRFANDAVPVELILRTAKNILTRPTDAHLAETARMLPAVILAMRAIKRDELRAVIEKTQAALEILFDRQ
jgi:GAF domain-containing protein